MLAAMLYLFYFLVVEQILQGFYSLWQGIQWSQMARRRLGTPPGFYQPRVALFCPVKGLEPGLEQNLTALTEFDYMHYEIFFAVASSDDPACRLLERIAASTERPVHIVCAGRPRDCGEKVHNLRTAVERAGGEFDVFVFTDSDGRPPRRWLVHLVAPLEESRLGAATTFRWLLPRRGFWSALTSAWNAPIVTFLGEHRHNFCWGGGTAIRYERFQEIRALEGWAGSVSDDFSLTQALWRAGFEIAFVPECLVPSLVETNAHGLFEFTNRQFVITRVYAPKIWFQAALGCVLYCAAVLLGIGLWTTLLLAGLPSVHLLLLALMPPLLCAGRGAMRLAAVLDLLPEWRQKLLASGWAWTLLAPLVPFVVLCNVLVAAFRRKILWRGTRYLLVSSGKTQIVAR